MTCPDGRLGTAHQPDDRASKRPLPVSSHLAAGGFHFRIFFYLMAGPMNDPKSGHYKFRMLSMIDAALLSLCQAWVYLPLPLTLLARTHFKTRNALVCLVSQTGLSRRWPRQHLCPSRNKKEKS
jgi:hypothetical protein